MKCDAALMLCSPLENLPRGIAAGSAHHTAARMAAGPAQKQPGNRRLVLRRARQRTHHEELVEGEIRMMPVSAGDPKLLLDIDRS